VPPCRSDARKCVARRRCKRKIATSQRTLLAMTKWIRDGRLVPACGQIVPPCEQITEYRVQMKVTFILED